MKEEDLFEQEQDKEEIGWCSYCKEAIYDGDEYVGKGKEIYHLNCYNQLTQYSEDYGTDSDEDV